MIEPLRVFPGRRSRARSLAVLAVVALGGMLSPLQAQAPAAAQDANPASPPGILTADFKANAEGGSGLQLTNCESCGTYGGPCCGPRAPSLGGAAACCYPGRYPCDCCDCPTNCIGAFFHGFYHCICCPDPCYEPVWKPIGNQALFLDTVRPVTQMKFGFDLGYNVRFPDKAELFWAREGMKGPMRNVAGGESKTDYKDVYIYNEAAVDRFSLFVLTPYRNIGPDFHPNASGFGDMAVGTKSLLLDCELIQCTFQFRAWLPTGNAARGVGTGHTSLEPSLLSAIKITNDDYIQTQLGFQFPLGGTAGFQGSLANFGASYNRMLCNCGKDLQIIGSLESNLWWITDGQYTRPDGTLASARDLSPMWNLGAGVRFVMCNKIDFGVGFSGAITDDNIVGQLLRTEFRWRF